MKPPITARYKMWKNSLYKWDSWIKNRHRQTKICDPWSRFIIENCEGKSVVVDSGGLFFKDFMPDITVVEFNPCPVKFTNEMQYIKQGVEFNNEFDNLILINPISLKLNHSIANFLTVPGLCRAGKNKPIFLDWLKKTGKIYLSISDWHIYYDRLKYTVHDMVVNQIRELSQIGIKCDYLEITPVNVDIENGNIKMVLSVKK
jgi:hypothetical protein